MSYDCVIVSDGIVELQKNDEVVETFEYDYPPTKYANIRESARQLIENQPDATLSDLVDIKVSDKRDE